MIDYSLYLVTDEKYDKLLLKVKKLLNKGVTLVQYRVKRKTTSDMLVEAQELKQICDKYKVKLLINDRIDIALAVGAAGVHLGQDDMPCKTAREILGNQAIIGVSVHNVKEAQCAIADGADYLGVGAIFPTNTKLDADVLGIKVLEKICNASTVPVVGIGGINLQNKDEVIKAGAQGVAMVSALLDGIE